MSLDGSSLPSYANVALCGLHGQFLAYDQITCIDRQTAATMKDWP